MEQQFIPGIHNYCDRWCERCPLTHRCRVYAGEAEMTAEQKDINNEAFWQYLSDSLQKALDYLQEHMEEMGVDWEELKEEALAEGASPAEELLPEQEAFQQLSADYYNRAKQWFEKHQPLFEERQEHLQQQLALGMEVMPEAQRLGDALEVINWYSFFISSKLRRALSGLNDEWMWKEFPVQNDANGSAKVTLLSIERSLAAWEVVRGAFPEVADELLDILVILGKLRAGIRRMFPEVDHFVRPGFDEPQYQVDLKDGN